MMSARKAKQRALVRMQPHPRPHNKFVPCWRYRGRRARRELYEMEIGTIEEFRFIVSPELDVMRQ